MAYTIQSGDTLSRIAQQNGLSLQQLLQLNPQFQSNPNLIYPGQQVNLSSSGSQNQQKISFLNNPGGSSNNNGIFTPSEQKNLLLQGYSQDQINRMIQVQSQYPGLDERSYVSLGLAVSQGADPIAFAKQNNIPIPGVTKLSTTNQPSNQNNGGGNNNQGGQGPTNSSNTGGQGGGSTDTSGQGGGTGGYNTGNPQLDAVLVGTYNMLQKLFGMGTTINPNATIDPTAVAQFMTMAQNNLQAFIPYATQEIAPYYQSQLAQAKQSFLTSVGYNEQQQLQLEQDLQRTYNEQLKGIAASAADQGFAQSGARQTQESDLAYNTNRQIQQGRQSLQNQTTQAAQAFASQYGGSNVPQVNITGAPEAGAGSPLAAGSGTAGPLYNISDSVYGGLIGSQQYQQTSDIDTRAGALSQAFQQAQGVQVPINYSAAGRTQSV